MAVEWKRILTEDDLSSAIPDQSGHSGEFLTTDGSNPSWAEVSGVTDNVARDNIVLLAWKLAIAEGLSVFNLEDGVVDEFEDETGIDTDASTNESYNSTDDYYSPAAGAIVDYMEYASDALAQAAYVTNGDYNLTYPPGHSDTYVKATTYADTNYFAFYATDPAKSLTGGQIGTEWASGAAGNQRFHIDLGSAKVINQIYYENHHDSGGDPGSGVKNFTFWGSNSATAFAELTYATDTEWTQLTTSQSTFDIHVAANQADPKYIAVYGSTAYRYYAFKFADNWHGVGVMALRHVALQVAELLAHSESTIKAQGSYSLKGIANTSSLNKTLTRTISSPLDLSGVDTLKFNIRASRTGSNIKLGIHDSGGTTTEVTPNITDSNTWQKVEIDLSGVADANKDAIDSIIITIVNADSANTFYMDKFSGPLENMTLISKSVEAEAEPTNARFIILVEPVDAITVNTDLKGYVSLDDGSNYEQVTLVDEGDFDATKHIYVGSEDLTDRDDKTMVWKIETANKKMLKSMLLA